MPAGIDLDQVEERAEHTVDLGEPLGAGAGVGGVESELQRFDPCVPPRRRLGCGLALGRAALECSVGVHSTSFGRLDLLDERGLDRLGVGTVVAQTLGLCRELRQRGAQLVAACGRAAELALAALDAIADRPELTAHLGGGARRPGPTIIGRDRLADLGPLGPERLLVARQCLGVGRDPVEGRRHLVELGPEPGGIGLQVGDDTGIEQLTVIAFERPPPLGEDAGKPTGAFPQLFDLHEAIADIALTARRELGLERHDLGVELRQSRLQLALGPHGIDTADSDRFELDAQAGDLAARHEHPQRVQFGDECFVALRCLRLPLERAELAADLAQEILEPEQVRLGRVETALGLLLALAVLEDAGGLLDDPSALLGASVEYGVDLALADDHVLLTADAGVRQQLLDVEQPAADAVDGVLAVAVSEQDAGECDLVELHRQQARGVVEREADLGAAEGRSHLRTSEDDIVHLLRPDRLRSLGSEDPGDRVDNVRLARAVRADDHGDARFEGHHGRVREGLEAFEGETLQEHGGSETTGRGVARDIAWRVRRSQAGADIARGPETSSSPSASSPLAPGAVVGGPLG